MHTAVYNMRMCIVCNNIGRCEYMGQLLQFMMANTEHWTLNELNTLIFKTAVRDSLLDPNFYFLKFHGQAQKDRRVCLLVG